MKNIQVLIDELQGIGVRLSLDGDKLGYKAPKGALTDNLRAEMAGRKHDIIAFLRQLQSRGSTLIPLAARDQPLPLSFPQQRIWLLHQLADRKQVYNIPCIWRLQGALDVPALEDSLNRVVARHESLRTRIVDRDGELVQVVAPAARLELPLIDLSHEPEREALAQQHIERITGHVFDLGRETLLRAALLRLGEQEYLLVLNLHHVIADGWSFHLLTTELSAFYRARLQGGEPALADLPVQYADFSLWQRQSVRRGDYHPHLAYWQRQLADTPGLLNLPTDRPRPPQQSFQGALHESALPASLLKQLKTLATQSEATLFMVLQAAFAVLLARYAGQDDILLGTPIANRNRLETEGLIGCFINTLVLRTRLDTNPGFLQLLGQVQKTTLDAYEYQDLPFDALVEALHPDRTTSHAPIFQVMFILQNNRSEEISLPGMTASRLMPDINGAAFDLTLSMEETACGMTAVWEYATALFDPATIQRMGGHFQVLLEGIAANPLQPVMALPLLTTGEKNILLFDWNNTRSDYPRDQCLHPLFEAQAARTPDAVAVVHDHRHLTYAALNKRANHLAHALLRAGVKPDTLVGICIERSLETAAAMLGVLKAGAAYVPLDPHYPPERLAYMLDDARIQVLLTQTSLADRFAKPPATVIHLDTLDMENSKDDANPVVAVLPEHLAYVIYTSGSTGRPKGVMIPHRALANRALALADSYALTRDDRVLQFAAFSFDVAAEEIFPTLLRGGCSVVAPKECTQSVAALMQFVESEQVTVLNLPAPYWHEWVLQLKAVGVPNSVRLVIAGSDKVLKERLAAWQQHPAGANVPVYCGYGPTEATITATLYTGQDATQGLTDSVLIGHPLADTQAYILDDHLQPVPIGVAGELHIAGAALARGYLRQPGLTDEKFIVNPFQDENAAAPSRLYKTGDLTRRLPDGNIEFLGRIDEQVKIRGFRIELGEIEAVLYKHPSVHEAVVLVKEKQPGDNYLVAYVVAKARAEVISHPGMAGLIPAFPPDGKDHWQQEMRRDLRAFIQKHLPDYMTPAVFMLLDSLPLTLNGKLDHKALPPPEIQDAQAHVPPRSATEKLLADIWLGLLDVGQVGAFDNFFNLGGHSLLVTRLLHHITDVFGVDLPVNSLFDFPTLASFAEHIDSSYQGNCGKNKRIDFHAEVSLDPGIMPPTAGFKLDLDSLDAVFLTGATGFVGAYLLDELLRQTSARIYCLVRADDVKTGARRLHAALAQYGLETADFDSRVIPVPGDLGLPAFGLSEEQFELLAQQIDAIYHNGAWVNHVYPYSVLKKANVEGTREALRLACHVRTKPLHFISSLSVFGPEITEMYEDAELDRPELLENGYVESKWVGDKLVALAGKRGLPVTIHRVSGATGITENGFSHVNDNFFRRVLTTFQLGIGLDTPLIDDNMVPVDFVGRAIVYLSGQRDSLGKAFHVGNPANTKVASINQAASSLASIRLLPPRQWQAEILRLATDNPEIGLHPLLPLVANYDFEREPDHILFDCRNMLAGLEGSGIRCPVIDAEKLAAYFAWLVEAGHLPLPRGKPRQDTVVTTQQIPGIFMEHG